MKREPYLFRYSMVIFNCYFHMTMLPCYLNNFDYIYIYHNTPMGNSVFFSQKAIAHPFPNMTGKYLVDPLTVNAINLCAQADVALTFGKICIQNGCLVVI